VDGVETEEDVRAKGDAGAVEELWTVGRNSGTWQTEPEPGRQDPEPGRRDPEPDRRDPEPDRRDPKPDRQDPEPGRRDPEPGRRQEHGSRIFYTRRPDCSREREQVMGKDRGKRSPDQERRGLDQGTRAQDQGRTGGTDCSFHCSKAQPDL
jgi:hypothetical protein